MKLQLILENNNGKKTEKEVYFEGHNFHALEGLIEEMVDILEAEF